MVQVVVINHSTLLDWAGCIATGKAWAGNKSKKGGVLYIAGEGQSGVGKRIKAWNIVNRETSDNLFRTKGAVNMTSKEAVEQVVSYCRLIKVHSRLLMLN